MSEPEERSGMINQVFEDLQEFIEMKLLYYKLVAYEKSAKLISFLIAAFLLIGFALSSYILINVAVGFMLADWLNSMYRGFAIIALFNLVLAILLFVFRRFLILNPLIDATVGLIAKKDENEQD